MTSRPRIGVAGLGSIGSRHARLLIERDDVDVHGFDPFGVDGALAPGLASVQNSFEGLLEAAPDGVIIATPDRVHVEQGAAALNAGVPALIEKPLAHDLAGARGLASLANETGTPALTGYVLRHHLAVQHLHRLVANGAVGAVATVHATLSAHDTLVVARNRFTPDLRFSLAYDYSHEWDYLQWLLGPIDMVAAAAHDAPGVSPTQSPNVIDVLLRFASGVTGSVHLDYVGTGLRSARVIGVDGAVDADLVAGTTRLTAHRPGTEPQSETFSEPRDGMFRRQLDHFLAVASGNAEPVATIAAGAQAIAIADAVVAAATGGGWVNVER